MLVKGPPKRPPVHGALLLIQLGDLGDVVLSLPAVAALKQRFSRNGIWMCVREKARGLVEDVPQLSGVMGVEGAPRPVFRALVHHVRWIRALRSRKFAMVVDLRTGSRGTVIAGLSGAPFRIGRLDHGRQGMRRRLFTHLVRPDPALERTQYAATHHLNILAAVGIPRVSETPGIPVPPEKQMQVLAFLESQRVPLDRPMVAISPFSLWRYKEWHATGWRHLASRLMKDLGVSILVTGAPEDRTRACRLVQEMPEGIFNLAGKTEIRMLPALFKACRLFIGVDSGSLHVAAAVGTPTVALFGPSSARTWAPRGRRHLTVSAGMPCMPCREKGCGGKGVSRCMDALTEAAVWAEVKRHAAHIRGIGSWDHAGDDRNREI